MRVLVTYGSRMGGTAGIAELVGGALRDAGLEADVRPAPEVSGLDPYGAVVVGGALYTGRWHRDARRFVKRHTAALQERPVWLFSSGRWTTRRPGRSRRWPRCGPWPGRSGPAAM